MKIHEYQAKELFRKYNVPTPEGGVSDTVEGVEEIAAELGLPVAVKAQIHAGGRGKGGGVKLADTNEAGIFRSSCYPGHDPGNQTDRP